MSKQLEIFEQPEYPMHGFKTKEEHDEELSIWYEVVMQNEREREEDLQIWFDVMMANELAQDEEFREDMYRYLDSLDEELIE